MMRVSAFIGIFLAGIWACAPYALCDQVRDAWTLSEKVAQEKRDPSERLEGIRLAREWQHRGDVAQAVDQPLIAAPYFQKVVQTFPDTAHAWVSKARLESVRTQLIIPNHSPKQDNSWKKELWDFLTWP